jgi:hypothetical protein
MTSLHLSVLLVFCAINSRPNIVSADDNRVAFDRLGFMQVVHEIKKAKIVPNSGIDASDTPQNKLPPGTILVYRTSDGNYGKLQVIEYGYNLTVRWQTYKPNGQKLKSADQMVIKGTWTYDLDFGTEGKHPKSAADFWWQQKDKVARAWAFRGGAIFKRIEPPKKSR